MNGLSTGGPGSMPVDQRLISTDFSRIDTLTSQPENELEISGEITHKHWKSADSSSLCANRACRRQFSLLNRHHHCRKCGNLFCAACLQHRRKLNQLAHFDPLQGRPYKVCKSCYEEGQWSDGCVRDLTTEFSQLREKFCGQRTAVGRKGGGWRKRINMDVECQRLLDGFKQCVGKSEFRRTLQEMRSLLSIPDWQKATMWAQESNAGSCQVCWEVFGLFRKRHFCKVCGIALCTSCSTADLLIYVPDDQVHCGIQNSIDITNVEPCLAIIKIVGCPEKEPEVSLYLRVCTACREHVIRSQMKRLSAAVALPGFDMLEELYALHTRFSVAEVNVNSQLRDYQEIVDSLENNARTSSSSSSSLSSLSNGSNPQSNMRTLAKAQEDLTDFLAQHVLVIQCLKQLVPKTHVQSRLLKNYIKAKCDFYLDNMSTFRRMKKKLGESSPPEVLEFIQRIMDKNAIISVHLYLRQLVYEVIHLCDKYELQDRSPEFLITLEQVIEKEVSACLRKEAEDVEQHLELMKEMIRTQMKDHKLIQLSRRALAEHGRAHVQHIMSIRVREILNQVTIQLKFKSANRSFPETKEALNSTTHQLIAT